ncbi:anti-sigma factor family protein [Paraburkholderia sp. ZP32-5]|uniref:anti-sigma factor family protein n=1 Tax=Paraburkholderia sp. ZP32-5 TaxID=2883245 RepID=UPI001F1B68A6|nr:transcriptional regulator [Paraburkholderia sp. ZP32-5]
MTSTDNRHSTPPSEADIQAYADGTLTPERTAALRDYLSKHPAEARRVAFYDRLNAQIQAAFRATDEPVPPRPSGLRASFARTRARRSVRRTLNVLAALVVTLAIVSGWLAAAQVSAQALDNAAVMALAEATAQGFSAASPTRADASTDASAPDLSALGMRVVEQRVLQLGPLQRANEFVYLNGDQQPVVILTAAAPFAREQPQWSARRVGEMRLLTWTAQRQRFVVAGNARAHGLMRVADVMTAR